MFIEQLSINMVVKPLINNKISPSCVKCRIYAIMFAKFYVFTLLGVKKWIKR